jgi:hypothetical protein
LGGRGCSWVETLASSPSTAAGPLLVRPGVVWPGPVGSGCVVLGGEGWGWCGWWCAASCWVSEAASTCCPVGSGSGPFRCWWGVRGWVGWGGGGCGLGWAACAGRHTGSPVFPWLGVGVVGGGFGCGFCVLVENCTVDASIFVVKLLRADGGCLGTRSR